MKIGLLGGTFDPPHFGHLIMAEEARVFGGLDEIWFLPAYIPPHKSEHVTEAQFRIKMVEVAISSNSFFKLSSIEYERKGLSYTYDTILALKEQSPKNDFYFILGGDMVKDLPSWHRAEELKNLIKFIGITRPGFPVDQIVGFDLQLIEMPGIDISSTMIRERIEKKKPFRYFLPEEVRHYIEEKKLYE